MNLVNGYTIITNNPLVNEKYGNKLMVLMIEGGCGQVLIKVRDLVHSGWKILTHPMAGSLKPNETPYRSIVAAAGDSLDCRSLELIENSIHAYEGFIRDNPTPAWNEWILTDFRFLDLSILESALISL